MCLLFPSSPCTVSARCEKATDRGRPLSNFTGASNQTTKPHTVKDLVCATSVSVLNGRKTLPLRSVPGPRVGLESSDRSRSMVNDSKKLSEVCPPTAGGPAIVIVVAVALRIFCGLDPYNSQRVDTGASSETVTTTLMPGHKSWLPRVKMTSRSETVTFEKANFKMTFGASAFPGANVDRIVILALLYCMISVILSAAMCSPIICRSKSINQPSDLAVPRPWLRNRNRTPNTPGVRAKTTQVPKTTTVNRSFSPCDTDTSATSRRRCAVTKMNPLKNIASSTLRARVRSGLCVLCNNRDTTQTQISAKIWVAGLSGSTARITATTIARHV
mmetsp:Transcript_44500/g.100602  ORF Transcript_44500/g.100602 Transcript_44500/m.100602 type:complete len:330 (+) Transcript_44500:1608-2597(+)